MNERPRLTAHYPDLPLDQNDPALLNLVDDLETLYTSHTLPARLERPVEEHIPISIENEAVPITPLASPGLLSSSMPQRQGHRTRLSTLAAVLFTALLVSALVATFALAHRQPGPASRTTNRSPLCGAKAPSQPLTDIRMMTATTGWALSWRINGKDTFQLAHTIDGGCDWKIVIPVKRGSLFAGHYAYISATAAWVELIDSGNSLFARTTDGGASWQYTLSTNDHDLISSLGGSLVTFLTPDIGWLLSSESRGTKRIGVALYHTVDGGLHWQKLMQNTLPSTPGGSLPSGIPYTGLSFLNQSTGWITADSGGSHQILLYVTHDGGKSWQKQNLSLPQGISSLNDGTIAEPPQFFSARDGVLPVLFWGPSGVCVYVTHDGGESWRSTAFLATHTKPIFDVAYPAPVPQFTSIDSGWLWEGEQFQPGDTLVVTHDGGQHWSSSKISLPAPYTASAIDFVSEDAGWLIGVSNPPTVILPLFKTQDGGKTWMRMNYSIS